jgi:hypothetical protein
MPRHPLCVTAFFLLVSCSPLQAQNAVASADSLLIASVPNHWTDLELNEAASLQLGDPSEDVYFMAFNESKVDLYGWNLERHSRITLAQLLISVDFPEVTGPFEAQVAGLDAVQYVLRGVIQGTRIVYLHTTVDGPDAFTQLLGWTSASRWSRKETTFRQILESVEFRSGTPGSASDGALDVWGIVEGSWTWEDGEGCESEAQTIESAPDRKGFSITHNPFEGPDGVFDSITSYIVRSWSDTRIRAYIPGETRLTDDGEPVEWDLIVISPDRLTWHRADWADGAATRSLRRCDTG